MDPEAFWRTGSQQPAAAVTPAPAGSPAGAPAGQPPAAAFTPPGQGGTPTPVEQPTETEDQRALREAREEAARARQQAQQLQGTLGQVEQWAQAQQAQQRRAQAQQEFDQQHDAIWAAAQNMGTEDAFRYAREQTRRLTQELQRRNDEIAAGAEQRVQQVARQFATPLWAQEVARREGLPPEAVPRLLAFRDPEVMQEQARYLAEDFKRQQTLQQQIDQLARSQQARGYQAQGVGLAGGQAAQVPPMELDSNPDIRAMQIYATLKRQQHGQGAD